VGEQHLSPSMIKSKCRSRAKRERGRMLGSCGTTKRQGPKGTIYTFFATRGEHCGVDTWPGGAPLQ
jgi:hypothetical protein